MSELFLRAVFADNLALVYFLGMCTLLAGNASLAAALGAGVAVLLVLTLTVPLNHLLHAWLLAPGAWEGFDALDVSYLRFLLFAGIILATLRIAELAIARHNPSLRATIAPLLPLVRVNTALLGASLFMAERAYDFRDSIAYAIGSGTGWLLAVAAFTALRDRLRYSDMPAGLSGPAAGFFIAGLLSMSFLALGQAFAP